MYLTRRQFIKNILISLSLILIPKLLFALETKQLKFNDVFNNTTVKNDILYYFNDYYYKILLSKLKIEIKENYSYYYMTDFKFTVDIKDFYTEEEIYNLIENISLKINNEYRYLLKCKIPYINFIKRSDLFSLTDSPKKLYLNIIGYK
jgi:hypothetical protein